MRISLFFLACCLPIITTILVPVGAFILTTAPKATPFLVHRASVFDDFEEFSSNVNNNNNNNNKNDADLYASLRARQADLTTNTNTPPQQEKQKQKKCADDDENLEEQSVFNWREANCVSTVRLNFDDWIRRMAIDTYPLVVCGSASGHLYLADLQGGEELDSLMHVHPAQANPERFDCEDALDTLYGHMDGGGVIALAIKDDLIASAGRDGGVHICSIAGDEEDVYKGSRGGTSRQTKLTLERQGKIRGLEEEENNKVLITSLAFDEAGILWMGGYDGILRAYDSEEQDESHQPLMLRQKRPMYEINVGSPILNLAVNDEIGCGVISTLSKGVVLFSLEDGEILGEWNPFVNKQVRNEFVRSAILVQNDPGDVWSVVCGGSRGSMFQRRCHIDRTSGLVSETRPFLDLTNDDTGSLPIKMRPNHMGPVVAFASPSPGLLVSGALDGTMRVWDCSYSRNDEEEEEVEAQYDDVQPKDTRPQGLYALSGYKVWLGSIFANGKKLVSDGADNTIIVHSFDEDEEDVMFREEEDDEDMEGFSFE